MTGSPVRMTICLASIARRLIRACRVARAGRGGPTGGLPAGRRGFRAALSSCAGAWLRAAGEQNARSSSSHRHGAADGSNDHWIELDDSTSPTTPREPATWRPRGRDIARSARAGRLRQRIWPEHDHNHDHAALVVAIDELLDEQRAGAWHGPRRRQRPHRLRTLVGSDSESPVHLIERVHVGVDPASASPGSRKRIGGRPD